MQMNFRIKTFLFLFTYLLISNACELKQSDDSALENEAIGEHSIFNLESSWNTQDSQSIRLEDLKGKVTVMVMIYTSCKVACPRLVADMRNIESDIPAKYLPDIQFVLVSIDPETDTPSRLKSFAKENEMEEDHWIFLQGSEGTTRELANVLSVKYEEISPIDFSHSNIISVFNPNGELVYQQEGLGLDNAKTIEKIISTLKEM